ncbi:MAG: hypothetical protein K6G80_06445 [Treponema sp.]|nr:hypothetical protein [Treponema sp.]
MKKKSIVAAGVLLASFSFLPLGSQSALSPFTSEEALQTGAAGSRTAATGLAFQEFRRGVQAYYKGSFNDSILEFEKALSYLPSENIILDWLGKAYYRSGIEGTALQHWQYAANSGYGGLLLQNRIEIVRERRINDNAYDIPVRYTEAGSFPGQNGETMVFSQPVSVLPNSDGTAWILAYGSNELVRIDVNGYVITRTGGPLNGFDRPLDMLKTYDGSILVSESAGDRISMFDKDGRHIKTFGSKGIGVGNMVGPQFMAQDADGNIYVTDFGNARVDVFDKDGTGLFYFGRRTVDFDGFKAPSGIAYAAGSIFVADAVTGAVYRFDTAGNYLGLLCREKTFVHPEAMKLWGNYLILCDSNKVYSVDVVTGEVYENANTGNAPSRLTCAVPDVNGNVLAADIVTNEVYVLSKMAELIGGLFVQIEKVVADQFPKVILEVKVENRRRQSIVGLKDVNFFVTENKAAVMDLSYDGAAFVNDTADITLLIDRTASSRYNEAMESAVREIAKAMDGKGTMRIISAGTVPVLEYSGSPRYCEQFSISALKNPVSPYCKLDSAFRLAANGLINAEKKRAIVLIGEGSVSPDAFTNYGLSDIAAYLNNNSVALSFVSLTQEALANELEYLIGNTDGYDYYVYRSLGLSGVVQDILDIPSGMYRLSYTSSLLTEYGQAYLPVEVEAYLMNRSGRDETGYFAPLQ